MEKNKFFCSEINENILNPFEDLMKEIAEKRVEILNDFAKAYLAEKQLKPSEVILVEKIEPNRIIWYFEKKSNKGDK